VTEAAGRDKEWIRPTQAAKLCGGMDRKTLHGLANRVGVRTMQLGAVTLTDGTTRRGERRYNAADIDVLAERLTDGDLDGRIVNGAWVPNE
jgi:hypothetical protein